MTGWIESVLGSVPHWTVYLVVFLLPFLEASVLLGFVFPGETALVFGGVLANPDFQATVKDPHGPLSLGLVLALAITGAITGDAVGYAVGRRYGTALQGSRLGQKVGDQRWATTEAFLQRRGGTAVFFGRWTALLRAMIPGAAGMAGVPYRTFFLWNVLGGTLWAIACVLGGYAVGIVIGSYVANAGRLILVLVVLFVAYEVVKRVREKRRDATAEADEAA